MLTIKNFDVLKGRSFVISFHCGYIVSEAGEYVSPVRYDCMYVLKLKSNPSYKDVSFSLYRDMNIKDKGYRLYNSISGDYTVIKLESFKDMRTFADILENELATLKHLLWV